jgi:hypothetical protein
MMDTEPEDTQPTPPPATDPDLDKAMEEVEKDPKKMLDGLPHVEDVFVDVLRYGTVSRATV